ncbi:MAG: metallophosphoesterase [Verrucomicrobia bacterium]|nr:metallophosphoesterase [Verrucomicrobiota bacterium]MDA1088647.1 metallophosphoesterase [Verrucomicrobiota bacterium]
MSETTTRLAWLTDIHLEFCGPLVLDQLFESIVRQEVDGILIGGDITTAKDLTQSLRLLDARLNAPIYFVLGNHDYYDGSVRGVRRKVTALCAESARLHWLAKSGVIELSPTTCLLGHGGWADGRCGDYAASTVMLNDYLVIQELSGLGQELRLEIMQSFARAAAEHFETILPDVLERYSRALVLMHVPPFEEATWHEGRISDTDWLPHFCCKCVGDVLREQMQQHPDREMLVLCGHTHGAGTAQILPNLRVITGGAIYGHPKIQGVIDVDASMDEWIDGATSRE